MTKTWQDFYYHIQPHVPGCPEDTINSFLRVAAAEFCARSEVWRYYCDTETTIVGFDEYQMPMPTGAVSENVLSVYVNGMKLKRRTDLDFDVNPTAPRGSPTTYSVFEDANIKLFPTPDASYTIKAEVVLKTSQTATSVPDFLFETHARAIAEGAMALLMMIPQKEWTNTELAAYYAAKFARACDNAKGRDTQRANRRVLGPKFA